MEMQIDIEILEANYRKLWLIERVNCPFIFAVGRIQRKWGLPLKSSSSKEGLNQVKKFLVKLKNKDSNFWSSKRFEQFVPVINMVSTLDLPKERKKVALEGLLTHEIPSGSFYEELKLLMKRFNFEDFWFDSMLIYLITGKIYPPHEQKSHKTPPAHVLEDWNIFLMVTKGKAQKEFLKKQYGLSNKKITELDDNVVLESNPNGLLPDDLIHDYTQIADKVWGVLDEDEWAKLDRKRINLVKKRLQRFRSYFVSCTEEDFNP